MLRPRVTRSPLEQSSLGNANASPLVGGSRGERVTLGDERRATLRVN
jgi:hypothetical protein